ncbi:MAG: membrane-fusion protein, partial [bacterium]
MDMNDPMEPSNPNARPGAEIARPSSASGWQRLMLLVRVVEIRLRFVVILVGVGLVIGYWDTLQNHWDKWTRNRSETAAQVATDNEFYCPMHPWVARSDRDPDGSIPKCPICGMSLSTRKKGDKPELPANVTGRVQFSPDRIRLAGLATEKVAYRRLVKELTTVGSVRYDEGQLSRIVTRVSGYVEKLLVNSTYEQVMLGQPMVELYSPELVSAVRELLLMRKAGGQAELAGLARKKLELFGVAPNEIDEVLRAGDAAHRLLIRSPQQGYVIRKEVVRGARVEVGQTLFEVADLSKVWIEADVYEKDVAFLRAGQAIEATVEAWPGKVFHGKVSLVHPMLEQETRTNTIRFSVENEGVLLRPGMYATVKISVPLSEVEGFRSLAGQSGAASTVSSP